MNPTTPALPDRTRRLLRAIVASTATGAALLWLTTQLLLPRLATSVTDAQRNYLRDAVASHPYWVMACVLAIAAVSALPVLLVFRAVYGPFRQ